jgi:hypothetical protein
MWYDQLDYDLDLDMSKEFLENDANFRVVLFRVDRANTNYDDVYGESDTNEIRFLSPVEVIVSALQVGESELKNYGAGNGSLSYKDRGALQFGVLTSTLKGMDVDIRRGDFIGYNYSEDGLAYYTVTDDGRMNQDNKHTRFGIKPYYRTVKCVPVDPNQFNGL